MTLRDLQADIEDIPLDLVSPGNGFARTLNEEKLDDIIESMKKVGQVQPGIVVKLGTVYQLLAGRHRLEALKRLGHPTFRAVVHPETMSNIDRLTITVVENLQRSDVHPLELAVQVKELKEALGGTNQQVATQLGVSKSLITKLLQRLEFDPELLKLVEEKKLAWRSADALAKVKDPVERGKLIERAISEGMTADEVEAMCREALKPECAVRKMVKRFAGGVILHASFPAAMTVEEILKLLKVLFRDAEKCAAEQPDDAKSFLQLLSMNRTLAKV